MSDQNILFILLGVVFALLVWGKIRYDLVAFGALILAVVIGVVPQERRVFAASVITPRSSSRWC